MVVFLTAIIEHQMVNDRALVLDQFVGHASWILIALGFEIDQLVMSITLNFMYRKLAARKPT